MSTKPWIKFYPGDWRSDPALRTCSVAARGLWIEMLCLMHEAEPYGHLNVKGVPLDDAALARLVGIGLKECRKLLAELAQVGVSSTTSPPCSSGSSAGVIFSRRMVADHAKALKDKENGKAGGNPGLTGGVNPQDKAQKLEARSQKELQQKGASPAEPSADRKSVPEFVNRMLQRYPEFGAQAARSPGLLSPAQINLWIGKGYDLALDIEPAVMAVLDRPRARPPGSWSYFENAVIDQNARRMATPEAGIPAAAPARTSRQSPDGTRQPDRDGVVRLLMRSAVDRSFQAYEPTAPEIANHLKFRVLAFLKRGEWNDDDLGAAPGHPACLVPPRIIERATAEFTAQTVPPPADGAGSTARH